MPEPGGIYIGAPPEKFGGPEKAEYDRYIYEEARS